MTSKRESIRINGIVQGVGFRPFVYRLATECGLSGFVSNQSTGVLVEVEGNPRSLEVFRQRIRIETPPSARIFEFRVNESEPTGGTGFCIKSSLCSGTATTLISPDIAVCTECLSELFDESDRRYRYPFINCTNCGPRYTIVHAIPYDRSNTSMKHFRLCAECCAEFEDPSNRRFHAQPNACPECGPALQLLDSRGQRIAERERAVEEAIHYLRKGRIIALRSLGGFHLAVDARNDAAVQELRRRKGREEKPLALMAPTLEEIRKFCYLSPEEEWQLQLPSRPIVLLRRRPEERIAPSVAPGDRFFGFMLPSAPLHYLLLSDQFEALVLTSGNYSEEPIVTSNTDALTRLDEIGDYFLVHNREIVQRCDDSIVRVIKQKPLLIRRARGYVPEPVFLNVPTSYRILACGGELKNTVALSRDSEVFLSQHIGDLDNPLALEFFEESIAHLSNVLEIQPQVIACDMHPEYLSTKWALEQRNLPTVAVQHHHAHLAALLVENRVEGPTIGIILDGTGYGLDGTIWGGEVLVGDCSAVTRHAWLKPFHLPGGSASIRQPWRTALSVLNTVYGEGLTGLRLPLLERLEPNVVNLVMTMISKSINAPLTSSCGRLFDSVSAILGICWEATYEAQAAVRLEMSADETEEGIYREALHGLSHKGDLEWAPLVVEVVSDLLVGEPVSEISARFHRTLVEIFVHGAISARSDHGIQRVGLSGGVFQNSYLLTLFSDRLVEEGFEVLTHSQVPTNDGGLALGQVAVADAQLKQVK